jgi:release factor glutamine methyltransferase
MSRGAAGETVGAAVQAAARRLDAAGLPNARLDARLLVAYAVGLDADALRLDPDRPLDAAARTRLDALLDRRARAREPVARILGHREFWSLSFALSSATLDPRPDSETVVEAVLRRIPDRQAPLRLLDLGTGTGCLLLALLSELPNATGIGIDIDPEAASIAAANAAALGLDTRARFIIGNWTEGLTGRFDWIVSNPPYIETGVIDALEPEVARHDPRMALDGGPDGLDAYREITRGLRGLLTLRGSVALEIGAGQQAAVSALLDRCGLTVEATDRDLAGRPRCVVAHAAAAGEKAVKKAVAQGVLTC